jgi:DNA-binding transcriptional MerR regulator
MEMLGLVEKIKSSCSLYRRYLQLRRDFNNYKRYVENQLQRLQLTVQYQNQKIALIEKRLEELERKKDSTEILLKVIEAISPEVRKN